MSKFHELYENSCGLQPVPNEQVNCAARLGIALEDCIRTAFIALDYTPQNAGACHALQEAMRLLRA